MGERRGHWICGEVLIPREEGGGEMGEDRLQVLRKGTCRCGRMDDLGGIRQKIPPC